MTSGRNWLLLAVYGLTLQAVIAQTVTEKTVPLGSGYSEEDFERSLAEMPNTTGIGLKYQTSPTRIMAEAKKISPQQACDMVERSLYATGTKLESELDDVKGRAAALEVQNALLRESEQSKTKAALVGYFCMGLGFVVGSLILWGMSKFWRRLIPRTARGRQISVLIPMALWSSFCFLGIANDSEMMRHPVNAAITALLWASPALLFGGILFWWFSSPRRENAKTGGE